MSDAEYVELREAAATRRLTVSEWVRQVLREARQAAGSAVREVGPAYASASPHLEEVVVDSTLLAEVMDRYRFPTRESAIHFALRRAADPPMTRDEMRDLRGSGWEGDLTAMRGAELRSDPG